MVSRLVTRTLSSLKFTHISATNVNHRFALTQLRLATNAAATPGRGNPTIVDRLPSTAGEVDVPEPSENSRREPSELLTVAEQPRNYNGDGTRTDWSRSYHGLSVEPFPKEAADILQSPIDDLDIEIKPGSGSLALSGNIHNLFEDRRVIVPA